MRKYFWIVAGAISALALAAPLALAAGSIETDNHQAVNVYAGAGGSAGKRLNVTDGGTIRNAHEAMCFADECVEVAVPATGAPDGGYYSAALSSSTWYELTVIADGSGGLAGCWDNGTRIVKPTDAGNPCFGLPKLKDGAVKPIGWPATPGDDAGVARVWFYASVSGGYTVTLCPQVACR